MNVVSNPLGPGFALALAVAPGTPADRASVVVGTTTTTVVATEEELAAVTLPGAAGAVVFIGQNAMPTVPFVGPFPAVVALAVAFPGVNAG